MVYKVISLFTGIGGFDFAFSNRQVVVHRDSVLDSSWVESTHPVYHSFVRLNRLPFEVVFQNDIIPDCKTICQLNGMESNYVLADIEQLILSNHSFPEAEIVIGGFPCQDFSNCGNRMGMKSRRGRLYQSFVDVVKKVKPLIFVCENVQGLLSIPDALDTIVSDFRSIGYAVEHQLIDCSNHGIPQKRKRIIIMGVNQSNKTGWNSIDSKSNAGWNLIDSNRINCQISKYYSHLESPNQTKDKSQKQYSKAKRLSKGQGQTTINMNAYAPTIRSEHHGNIEFFDANRRLTVRECALAQTFPPGHLFGTMSTAYKQIGNAVPPLLSYMIAHKVHEILKRICVVSSNYKMSEEDYQNTSNTISNAQLF